MLFNSYGFIFMFLPITLLIYFQIGKHGYHQIAIAWLVASSLFFYGWWNPSYLILICLSILFNYTIGLLLSSIKIQNLLLKRKILLIFGLNLNILLLGYYKYFNFFINNINCLVNVDFNFQTIILPIGISFFTFTQIAYLVDVYKANTREYNFLNYCLFVTFYPHLLAGPILHHKEILPQFTKRTISKLDYENLAVGLTIFFIGLFKKTLIADGVSASVQEVFYAAGHRAAGLTFIEAWVGILFYTMQIYFDFSGYCDMAIGISRMFGIKLPLNFNSPYKAANIIEFWRCWHITLSRFLRDYLYIPLGGSHKGKVKRYINLMITMILGGLWHGAGWNFILWGLLHGLYLVINHVWRALRDRLGHNQSNSNWLGRRLSQGITFIAVVAAWVFFRADNLNDAINILRGMSGMNGVALPSPYLGYLNHIGGLGKYLSTHGWIFNTHFTFCFYGLKDVLKLFIMFLIIWLLPNTQEFMIKYKPAFETYSNVRMPSVISLRHRFSIKWVYALSILAFIAIIYTSNTGVFLYFNF